jgi:Domain of unknown function (DUF4149)
VLKLAQLLVLVTCAWTGAVLAIAFIGAPAAFAVLPSKELAGAVAAQLFKGEAYGSLLVAALAWIALRPSAALDATMDATTDVIEGESKARVDWPLWTAMLVILIATILGYFALTPQMQAIKAAQGSGSSAYLQMHGASMGLYAVKALAWVVLSALLVKRLR